MDPWHIPALQHTSHMWHIAEEAPVSRSRRSRGNGPYESAVPITLSDLTLDVPAPLMALIEDASVALAQFDGIAAHHLGGQIHTLGPMSAVLLRTEATSSSQIEHLTVGAKNLAMELLHEGNSENAAVVVGNVRAMESALRLSADLNVENLLSISRIENGQMRLHLSLDVVGDVVEEALRHADRKIAEHRIVLKPSEELLLVRMDAGLITQVLINLVNNAVKYTGAGGLGRACRSGKPGGLSKPGGA